MLQKSRDPHRMGGLAGISKILNATKRKMTNILSGKIGSSLWRSESLYGQTVWLLSRYWWIKPIQKLTVYWLKNSMHLWNKKVHHKCLSHCPSLNQFNPLRILRLVASDPFHYHPPIYVLVFQITFCLKASKNELPISPTLIQAPPVPSFLDLMALTTVRERLKLPSSSNMYLFPLLITSPFLGPSLSWNRFLTLQSRNILVGIATGQRDRRSTNRGLILGRGRRLSLLHSFQNISETQSPSQIVGTDGFPRE